MGTPSLKHGSQPINPRSALPGSGAAGTRPELRSYAANAAATRSVPLQHGVSLHQIQGDDVMKKLIPAVATAAFFVSSTGFAQTTPPTQPSTPPAAVAPTPKESTAKQPTQTPMKLSETEAKALIDATVVSSDNQEVGEVAAIQRDSEGKVTELHADIGGFLGFGQSRIRLMPSQFTVSNKRVMLTLTAEQVSNLPKIEK
jgi:hypothetical protein